MKGEPAAVAPAGKLCGDLGVEAAMRTAVRRQAAGLRDCVRRNLLW